MVSESSTVVPIGDMIQNITVYIRLTRDQFVNLIRDSTIIRGTLCVCFYLRRPRRLHRRPLHFFFRGVDLRTSGSLKLIHILPSQPSYCTELQYNIEDFENALRLVLGLGRPRDMGLFTQRLKFFSQQFLHAQPSRQIVDWMTHL